jgi:lipopolysaccharide export system permease protein
MDRYLLRLTTWPLLACLGLTVVSLLLERALRLVDVLSHTNGLGRVFELTTSLIPHFLGLALPVAFFVALFIVIARLDDGSEIAALLAGGVSLTRIAAPLIALAVFLMAFSLVVFGYVQPYSRYMYRAVFHAAVTAGWNGRLPAGDLISKGDEIMTADSSDIEGNELRRIFIRRPTAGGEQVITAASAQLARTPDGKSVTFMLHKGAEVQQNRNGTFSTLAFDSLVMQTDLAGAETLMRARGGDQRELTLSELVRDAAAPRSLIPRGTLLAELYARVARSIVLPFLPLMAFPLGLAAKRGRRTAGLLLAGLLLLAFQYGLQFGQGLAVAGRVSPELAVGLPFGLFTGFCVWLFAGSRRRPGETPVGRFVEALGDGIERMAPRRRGAG